MMNYYNSLRMEIKSKLNKIVDEKNKFALFFFILFSAFSTSAQVTVTSATGTSPSANYLTLASAITAINDGTTHTGTILCEVIAGHVETAPVGGFSISATGTSTSTITFIKSGTGSNPAFTASGALVSGTLTDAIFKIIGGDFITIDGFTMLENAANVTTVAGTNNMTEFGVALFYATATNGCQNVTIRNCTIDLTRTYQNTFGIYSNSTHTAIAATTSATATGLTGGNNNLTITGNTITDVNQGISIVGPTAAADHNDGLTIGGTGLGNTITNYGSTGTFSSFANISGTVNGILVRNTKNFTISNNTVTSSIGGTTAGTLRGIFIPAFSNAPIGTFTNAINNNTLNIQSGVVTGAISGIISEGTTSSATSVIAINNNTFNGLSHTIAAASGALIFIQQVGPHLNVSVSNNTFNSLTANTTGSATFISANYSMPTGGTQVYNNNTISGGFNKTGAGGSVICYTSNASSPTGTTHTATGNNFSGITVTGATTLTGWSNTDGGTPTKTITGNTFSNWTGGTSLVTAIIQNFGSNNSIVSNNTVNNITSQSSITGINIGGSNTGSLQTVANNTVTNLTLTGTGAGSNINGIAIGGHTVTALNVNNNIVNTFNNASSNGQVLGINAGAGLTGTTNVFNHSVFGLNASGVTPLIGGIAALGTTGNINLYANKIHTLNASAATTNSGAVNGFVIQGGVNVNCYNNIVGGLTNPLGTAINSIMGIQVQSTVAASTYKLYNNSVYLNATSTGTNFGTTGLFHAGNATATIGALDMIGNIIINQSVANGTGITAAFRRSIAALNNYQTSSNRNLFFAGTPSATNVIYNDGTTSYQTIADFKTFVSTRESLSFTREGSFLFENPGSFFIDLTPTNANFLKPVSGITSQIESGGITFPTIFTTDYNGVIRGGNTGYVGTGTSPDLGAFEFNGVTPSPVIVLNSVTPPATNQCITSSRLVSVSVNPSAGTTTSVTLNYSFNGVAQAAVSMTNTSGSIWEGTIPASVPTNATVTWFINATNSIPITSTFNGVSYKDEPLLGVSGVASASNAITCAGSPSILTAALTSANPANYTNPTAVTNPVSDEDLGNVTITNTVTSTVVLNNTTPINSLIGSIGTATGTAGSYSNFTSFGPYALSAGTNYSFSLSSLTTGTSYNNSMAIYIDYNRNGVFTDAGEKAYAATAVVLGAHTETGNFTIPTTVFNGLTRMRVISNEGLIADPNLTVAYGEFEDYSVNISGGTTGGGLAPAITTVSWSDGTNTVGTTNNLSVSPTSTTTYTATVVSSGCLLTPSPTVTVTVNPLPTAPTATNSSQCGAQIPTASVADNNSFTTPIYKWYADNTTTTALQSNISTTYLTSINSTTTFYVSVTNPVTTCESTRTPVTVTVTAPQSITLSTPSTVSSCLGNTTNITASSNNSLYTYSWTASPVSGSGISGTVNGASQAFTPTALGTYIYTVVGTDGICTASNSVTITVNNVPTALTVAPVVTCPNTISTLNVTGGAISNITILNENFNGTTNNWTTTNNSTGGTPANIAWTLKNSPFDYSFYGTFSSNDASQFYLSNNDAGGSGSSANTALISPSFSTVGYSTAKISFWHYFRNPGDAKVEYSIDNAVTWNTVQTFTTTTGAVGGFVQQNIVLPTNAANQANVKIRFKYDTVGWQYFWAIDNVRISGDQSTTITWSPTTNLFTDAAATIPYAGTNASTVYFSSNTSGVSNYTVTSTSTSSCTASGTAIVTVNPNATITLNSANATQTVCFNTPITSIAYNTTNATGATVTGLPAGITGTYNAGVYTISGTATVGGVFNYTVTPTGCGSASATGTITVNLTPAPTATAQTLCSPATVANLTATGTNLQWYTNATGGTALLATDAISTNTYYVSQTLNTCESTRTAVDVIVNVTAPPTASNQSFCAPATVANLVANGTNLQWYNSMTGGSALAPSTTLSTGNYYVSQTLLTCESTRTLVVVTINDCTIQYVNLQFPGSATIGNCGNATFYAQVYKAGITEAAGQGAGITAWIGRNTSNTDPATWSEASWQPATFNVQVGNNDEYLYTFSNLPAGTYYVASRFTYNNAPFVYGGYPPSGGGFWNGTSSVSAVLTVNTTAAPTGSANQSFGVATLADATIEDLVVTGTLITWYPTLNDAQNGTNALAPGTQIFDGQTYYSTNTVNGCASTPFAVTVSITLRNDGFDVTSLKYYPNPVLDILNISYSNVINKVEVINLIGQVVKLTTPNVLNTELDMSNLPTATYLVKVTSEGKTALIKVVKK